MAKRKKRLQTTFDCFEQLSLSGVCLTFRHARWNLTPAVHYSNALCGGIPSSLLSYRGNFIVIMLGSVNTRCDCIRSKKTSSLSLLSISEAVILLLRFSFLPSPTIVLQLIFRRPLLFPYSET